MRAKPTFASPARLPSQERRARDCRRRICAPRALLMRSSNQAADIAKARSVHRRGTFPIGFGSCSRIGFVFPNWVWFGSFCQNAAMPGSVGFVLPKCLRLGLVRSPIFTRRCTRSSYPLMPSRSRGPLRAGYARACRSRGNVDERQWRFPIAQLRHEVNKFIRKVVTAVPELQR